MNENSYDTLFEVYGKEYGFSPLFLKAQVKQESNFNPNAENKYSHAKGLAQFMDATWKEWGEGDPFNPEDSIKAQAKYMDWIRAGVKKRLFNKADWERWTLASYNWGVGYMWGFRNKAGIYVKGVMQKRDDFESAILLLPLETKDYVKKIMGYYSDYQAKFFLNNLGQVEPRPTEEIK